jgi:lipopolysaccharide export system protein LptA
MKKLLILMLAGSCGLLWAQTNLPVTLAEPETNAVTDLESSQTNAPSTNAEPVAVTHLAKGGSKTNAPAVPPKPVQPTVITSESGDFDAKQLIYRGTVRVTGPEANLNCELLTLDLPPGGGHVTRACAETNVVIDFVQNEKKYHVTSDKAVYDYKVVNQTTNETVTLTGTPKVESSDGTMTGEPMVWNRATGHFYGTNIKIISLPSTGGSSGTNGLPLKLF